MPLFRKRSSAAPGPSADAADPTSAKEEWGVFEGENDGRPMVTRFNVGLAASAGHPSYGIQIGVAVPLNAATDDGLPTPEESEQLQQIEDQLDQLVAGRAVLAGVITTSGMREFVLYTGASEWIEGFHHALEAAVPTHEVQVMAQKDPSWSVYRQFVD